MYVRAHHLWILQGIIEKNGSVSHLSDLREQWKEIYQTVMDSSSEIILIDTLDKICLSCPDHLGDECNKYQTRHLKAADDTAVEEFGIEYNKPYSSQEVVNKLKGRKIHGTNLVRV